MEALPLLLPDNTGARQSLPEPVWNGVWLAVFIRVHVNVHTVSYNEWLIGCLRETGTFC